MNPPLDTDASVAKMTVIVCPEDLIWVPAGTVPHKRSNRGALGTRPFWTYRPMSKSFDSHIHTNVKLQ